MRRKVNLPDVPDCELLMQTRAGRITYRTKLPAPPDDRAWPVRIELSTRRHPWRPSVHVDGPVCLRHRFRDRTLCMWFEAHPNSRKWVLSDGITQLLRRIQLHLFQEATCRAGEPWPGEEAPGEHPRATNCPSCHGKGP
jgi:hypothetical protein